MMTKKMLAAAVFAIAAGSFSVANAQPQPPQPAPHAQPPHAGPHTPGAAPHISWVNAVTAIEGMGYKIEELDMKPYGWSAEVRDNRGFKIDLTLDREAKVVSQRYD